MQKPRFLISLSLAAALLAGCSYYKLDVQQGNVVTDRMVAQLRPGMTKRQVRYVLGTPLVQDPFHQSRWDYVYGLKKGNKPLSDRSKLTVFFENDSLQRVERDGQVLALTGQPDLPSAQAPNQPQTVLRADSETLEQGGKEKKKGLFRRLWEKVKR